jgi:cyclohexanone monooxygenase/acetone monooxygenase
MKNPQYGDAEQNWYKSRFEELRSSIPHTELSDS